jgi:hypothetical protein
MEPESSLPCLQKPAAGPYPEPDESIVHFPTLFPQYLIWYYFPIYS